MKNKNLRNDLEQLKSILKDNNISRRDAMKIAGLSGASFVFNNTEANAKKIPKTIDSKAKILIIGGGLSGISTASKLTNSLLNPDITIIEPNSLSAQYQAGQIFVASGIWEKNEIIYYRDDFIPNGVKVINEKAVEFYPNDNQVITDNGTIVKYDFMVIAAGVKLNYAAISGLEEAEEVYSAGDNQQLVKILNEKNVSSIYTAHGAEATWLDMQKLIRNAKNGKKQNAIFTHPNTLIKNHTSSKNIMYLTNSRLEDENVRNNVNMNFYTNDNNLFDITSYNDAIIKQFETRNFKCNYNYNLIAVDGNIATFNYHNQTNNKTIKVPYDFIHITPPMKVPDEIGTSKIGSKNGWVPVNKETLQHTKYKNIFALGDIADIPMGKTRSSIKEQYKIVANNIISMIKTGNIPISNKKYNGYTECPLFTNIGTVMLTQFNWNSKKIGSGANVSMLPLDTTKERYIWWLLEFYLSKPITQYGMLSGHI